MEFTFFKYDMFLTYYHKLAPELALPSCASSLKYTMWATAVQLWLNLGQVLEVQYSDQIHTVDF